ncbi:MAG: MFS transporter [Pseudomonadales bacterium]
MPHTNTPQDTSDIINSKPALFTAVMILSIAYLVYNMLPVILGSAADSLGLNEQQMGYLGSIYMAGSTIANVVAVLWIRSFNWRKMVMYSSIVATACYLGGMAASYQSLLILFFVLGIVNGCIVSVAVTCLGDTRSPDRSFGFGVGFQVALAGILAFLLPITVVPLWGFNGVMVALAGTVFISLFLLHLLPEQGPEQTPDSADASSDAHAGHGSLTAVWMGITALMIYALGQSAIWAFLDRIALNAGIDNELLGLIFGITLILSAAGGFIASYTGAKFGRIWPVVIASSITLVSFIMMPMSSNPWVYAAAVLLFAGAWNFILPFQMTIIIESDSHGKLTPMIPACQLLGSTIGPALAGNLIFDGDYFYVYLLATISTLISMVMFVGIEKFLHRSNTELPAVAGL